MESIELHPVHSGGKGSSSSVYSPALQPLMQSLLSALADIDFAYEHERERINNSSRDANLRMRLLERLRRDHHNRREPYVQQLAILQKRIGRGAYDGRTSC
jgi:hypothetical protein